MIHAARIGKILLISEPFGRVGLPGSMQLLSILTQVVVSNILYCPPLFGEDSILTNTNIFKGAGSTTN